MSEVRVGWLQADTAATQVNAGWIEFNPQASLVCVGWIEFDPAYPVAAVEEVLGTTGHHRKSKAYKPNAHTRYADEALADLTRIRIIEQDDELLLALVAHIVVSGHI